MRNIRIEIEYDGSGYAGWQVQNSPQCTVHSPQKRTIQGTIEKTLQKILKEKVKVIASGRTDAGVSALAQVANFHTHCALPVEKIKNALNALLPKDIAVSRVQDVPLDFHAIRDVRSKVYRYRILNRAHRPALSLRGVYFCRFPLDSGLMRREARVLIGRHDFKAFCASGSSARSTVRTIKKITVGRYPYEYPRSNTKEDNSLIIIDIEADGFLYNMARSIAGTLVDIGRGRFKKSSMKSLLSARDRRLSGPCAPAQGLCLLKVKYPCARKPRTSVHR
ncbi:MAG: tRNA pseudouridine(38-40) synthase TruA [Candidatus Omnitrophica bacterium]|nr:tRNA pseudouridine(38-40) synthase TruA [Candidatus Omnitrophota bacterium]